MCRRPDEHVIDEIHNAVARDDVTLLMRLLGSPNDLDGSLRCALLAGHESGVVDLLLRAGARAADLMFQASSDSMVSCFASHEVDARWARARQCA